MGMGFAPTWFRQVSPPLLHKTTLTTVYSTRRPAARARTRHTHTIEHFKFLSQRILMHCTEIKYAYFIIDYNVQSNSDLNQDG